jgi:hypothetical protein
MPAVRAVVLLGVLLAQPALAESESLLPPTCEALLAPGEYSTRFRVIDPVARVTACRMKGVIEADIFDLLVKGRVAQWSARCFSEREQAYLHGVLRQATLQSMPFVTEENCAENLERLLKLPEPRKPR